MNASPLNRTAFRDEIAQAALELVVSGELPPGSRIKDSYLAEELGTSPTPAREALVELARRGFVKAIPQRGFWVPELERKEVLDLYPLVAGLESLAMEASSSITPEQHQTLVRIGRAMEKPSLKRLRWLSYDREWHETLLVGCTNLRLMSILGDLRLQIQRYELACANVDGDTVDSTREHAAIAAAFGEDDRRRAATALRSHWHRGMEQVLKHFE